MSLFKKVFIFVILLSIVSLTVFVSQNKQTVRQRAEYDNSCLEKCDPINDPYYNECVASCSVVPTPNCEIETCTCEQTCRSAPGDPSNCLSICASQGLAPTEYLLPPTITPIPTPEISIPTPTISYLTPQTISSPTPVISSCHLKNKGDANCDNFINIVDFQIWKTDFVNALKGIINNQSDFNNNGLINIVDFNIWKTNL